VSREPFLLSGFAIAATGFAIAILPKWRLTHNTLRDDAHRTLAIDQNLINCHHWALFSYAATYFSTVAKYIPTITKL
jgi:hypothetical protein